MSKYADIVRKGIDQPQSTCDNSEQVTIIDEEPKYNFTCPPSKRGNYNYDRWEYAYFSHLVNMYRIVCEDSKAWDPKSMYKFFLFIYYVSSGKISSYLDDNNEELSDLYYEYLIKRKEI